MNRLTSNFASAMALGLAAFVGTSAPVAAQETSQSAGFYESLSGKRIGFVPIAMGFNETQAWRTAMERQAETLGYEVIVRDPNWSIEVGIQAINSLIEE